MKMKLFSKKMKDNQKIQSKLVFLKSLNDLPVVLNLDENGSISIEYDGNTKYSRQEIELQIQKMLMDLGEKENADL